MGHSVVAPAQSESQVEAEIASALANGDYQTAAEAAALIAAAVDPLAPPYVETLSYKLAFAAGTVGADFLLAYKVRFPDAVSQARVDFFVGTANGNIDVGVYSSDGTTLTEVASTGSTATAGASAIQTIAFTAPFVPNPALDYYVCGITDSATLTLARVIGLAPINLLAKEAVTKAVTYATAPGLPASSTLASLSTGLAAMYWFRVRP